jgi:hypothetical protein
MLRREFITLPYPTLPYPTLPYPTLPYLQYQSDYSGPPKIGLSGINAVRLYNYNLILCNCLTPTHSIGR